ncbi:hypothetical protein [Seonamhaeicola marinus]|nr:hypothetical protein [Seonamhaeicola marinus]
MAILFRIILIGKLVPDFPGHFGHGLFGVKGYFNTAPDAVTCFWHPNIL